jgi:hypothetical protein
MALTTRSRPKVGASKKPEHPGGGTDPWATSVLYPKRIPEIPDRCLHSGRLAARMANGGKDEPGEGKSRRSVRRSRSSARGRAFAASPDRSWRVARWEESSMSQRVVQPDAGRPVDPHFDPLDPDYLADPYPYFARFRKEAPIFYAPKIYFWVVSRRSPGWRSASRSSCSRGGFQTSGSRRPTSPSSSTRTCPSAARRSCGRNGPRREAGPGGVRASEAPATGLAKGGTACPRA